MIQKLKDLIIRHYDILAYLFFGVLTTAINYLVYLPCYNWLRFSATLSNVIAWVIAVIFAFLTNKPFVFRSHDWSPGTLWPELAKFVGCRVGSGLAETFIIAITVDIMHLNGNWMKLLTNVLVVILNYIGSKLFVFRNKKSSG